MSISSSFFPFFFARIFWKRKYLRGPTPSRTTTSQADRSPPPVPLKQTTSRCASNLTLPKRLHHPPLFPLGATQHACNYLGIFRCRPHCPVQSHISIHYPLSRQAPLQVTPSGTRCGSPGSHPHPSWAIHPPDLPPLTAETCSSPIFRHWIAPSVVSTPKRHVGVGGAPR